MYRILFCTHDVAKMWGMNSSEEVWSKWARLIEGQGVCG